MTLFSDERWHWFRGSLSSANELLERTLAQEESSLCASPHYNDPEDYAEALHYGVENPVPFFALAYSASWQAHSNTHCSTC
jgi:hypothetical protein